MKMLILLFFLLIGCSNTVEKKTNLDKINIYENLSFEEFKSKITNYAKNSNFPNIKN